MCAVCVVCVNSAFIIEIVGILLYLLLFIFHHSANFCGIHVTVSIQVFDTTSPKRRQWQRTTTTTKKRTEQNIEFNFHLIPRRIPILIKIFILLYICAVRNAIELSNSICKMVYHYSQATDKSICERDRARTRTPICACQCIYPNEKCICWNAIGPGKMADMKITRNNPKENKKNQIKQAVTGF